MCGYTKIIRIDEDIIVDFNIMEIFNKLESKIIIIGKWEQDLPDVTKNLINFCNEYYEKK